MEIPKSSTSLSQFETINRADANPWFPSLREIWRYRFLLRSLIIREFLIRYKQTVLGIGWAVFAPLITVLIFTFVFDNLADVPSYNIPYPIFAYAGLVPWTFFASGLTYSSTSIVSNQSIIAKTYFPRILAPLSKQFSGALDAVIAFAILLIMMLGWGYVPTVGIVAIPFFVLIAAMTAFGLGLIFSAIHVRFRDVGLVIPYMVQMLLYLTPVAYPSDLLNGTARIVYGLNPMVTVCDGFRWALLGTDSLNPTTMLVSTIAATLFMVSGLVIFQRLEGGFADYL